MAFATIVDYDAQLTQDRRIPEAVLQQAKDVDYNSKVVLFAYLGATSGAITLASKKSPCPAMTSLCTYAPEARVPVK